MSKVLFVNGNLYGHLNPTLPVVAELIKRGEEVWYFCSKLFEDKIGATGAHFIDSGENLEKFLANYKPTGNHPFYALLEYIIKYDCAMLPELIDKVKKIQFDYVIYDSILGAGCFLKAIMKVPIICSNSSFAMSKLPVPDRMMQPGFHPQLDEFYEALQSACREWNVKISSGYELFINKGDMNLVYTSKEFNSEGEYFDDSYKFVGPSIKEGNEIVEFPFEKIEGEKVVYISLGTINTDFNNFYKMCITALGDLNFKVVMSVGKKCDINLLGEIPDNFIVCNFAPQLEILKNKTSVFISHGGFNSVSEALYYGVPIITIPMVNDQYMVAKRLVNIGAGIALQMNEISEFEIKESVLKILSDSKYKDASERIGKSFHLAGGYESAVDYILEFVKG